MYLLGKARAEISALLSNLGPEGGYYCWSRSCSTNATERRIQLFSILTWCGKSEITTFRVSVPHHNGLISGNSLVFGATILILCLFVSIHGNTNKQRKTTVPGSVMPPLCHLPYKFYSLCSCLSLLLLRFKFYSALRWRLTTVPVTFWQSLTV